MTFGGTCSRVIHILGGVGSGEGCTMGRGGVDFSRSAGVEEMLSSSANESNPFEEAKLAGSDFPMVTASKEAQQEFATEVD